MAWRCRKILGLIQTSELNKSEEEIPNSIPEETFMHMGESTLPADISEHDENVNPFDSEFDLVEYITDEAQSKYTEIPKDNTASLSIPNNDSETCTTVETETLVDVPHNIVSSNKIRTNLVPDYESDGFSYEDELETVNEVAGTPLTSRRISSSLSCSSKSSSSSSSSNSASSTSKENSDEQTGERSNSHGGLDSAIVHTAGLWDDIEMENTPQSICESNSATVSRTQRRCVRNSPISISPIYTDESDVDDEVVDPDFDFENKFGKTAQLKRKNLLIPSDCSDSSSSDDTERQEKKGRKRVKNPTKWKQNRVKKLRNKGKAYVSMSKTHVSKPARCLKAPCTDKCKLKCTNKIDHNERFEIFDRFWQLGNLEKQRNFIKSCMINIEPKYKYTNAQTPRRPNKAFYFKIQDHKTRVCKTFFRSTLDISERMIYTIITQADEMGFVEDKRGRHGNNRRLDPELLDDIRKHIDTIPRVESHYVRANSSRQYIEGGRTIKDLYRDFCAIRTEKNKNTGSYITYYNIFTTEFNLSFHRPKKDQCDQCIAYENIDRNGPNFAEEDNKYHRHIKEKELSRKEKLNDRININNENKVVIYDLEAVLQCPKGDTSAFYYKSKLNSYNLTLTELNKKYEKRAYDNVYCYFWTECDAKRGAVEIGSCIWEYLKKISFEEEAVKNIIFYTDNCCGQNKNKYVATLYMYAVNYLNINSITHKFMIRGHTQNEADAVHSIIEKEVKKNLKSGPIYTPDQYIALIKNAKKTRPPITVHEMTYDSFVNLKELQEEWGYNFSTNTNGQIVNWNDIKQLVITKDDPFTFKYKSSYEDEEFKEVNVRNKRKKMKPVTEIVLKKAYISKQELSINKKKDLKELLSKGLIPSYYADFYNSILE